MISLFNIKKQGVKAGYYILLFILLPGVGVSQFYTNSQINTIHLAKSANEGDIYLDTINQKYYIGLGHGYVAKIGDTIDELIDSVTYSNDTIYIYEHNSLTKVKLSSVVIDSLILKNAMVDTLKLFTSSGIYSVGLMDLDSTNEIIDSIYRVGDSIAFLEGGHIRYVELDDHDWYKANSTRTPSSINDSIYTYGSVGIGTNSPDKSLHITGQVKIEGVTKGNNTDSILVWKTSDSTLYYLPIDSLIPQRSQLFFAAEYAGAVFDTINGTLGAHLGYMTANNSRAPTFMNYYEWNSSEMLTQDYDIVLRFRVPDNFSSWGTTTISNTCQTRGSVSVQVRNITTGGITTPLTNVTNAAWTNTNLNLSAVTTNPGDIIVFIITLKTYDFHYARVGDIILNYNL